MADAQLEGLVQHMLDGGADDTTIREAVGLYQAKQAQRPDVAQQTGAPSAPWPGAARLTPEDRAQAAQAVDTAGATVLAAGMTMAGGAALGPLTGRLLSRAPALVKTAADMATRPAVTATAGGIEGYRHGGVFGALTGAVSGGSMGKLGRAWAAGRGAGAGAVRTLTPAAKAATEGLAKLPTNLVLTPEQAAQEVAWRAILQQEASKRGLGYAAGVR